MSNHSSSPVRRKSYTFARMAQTSARVAGSSAAFVVSCGIVLLWLLTGPMFHWSNGWQLVINTVTNIISVLMVFLIQNTQNRGNAALQLKMDELLRSVRNAQNSFINLEELAEEELQRLKARYAAIAQLARQESGTAEVHGDADAERSD